LAQIGPHREREFGSFLDKLEEKYASKGEGKKKKAKPPKEVRSSACHTFWGWTPDLNAWMLTGSGADRCGVRGSPEEAHGKVLEGEGPVKVCRRRVRSGRGGGWSGAGIELRHVILEHLASLSGTFTCLLLPSASLEGRRESLAIAVMYGVRWLAQPDARPVRAAVRPAEQEKDE
jgi:hypothetical protein